MDRKKETLIVLLTACIVLTPILACTGIKGAGALVYLWGLLVFLWWNFYGKDKAFYDKVEKGRTEARKKYEGQEAIWNTEAPKRRAEIERQRRAAGLVTDSSFKEYIRKRGFDVIGDIKIAEQTFNESYHNLQPKTQPSEITIITNKSMNQLRQMGINNIRQLLGDYHKYFFYRMNNVNGGFQGNIVESYDERLRKIEINDLNNMCAKITYYPELDKNVNILWTKDNIYYIEIEGGSKRYTVYRDRGVIVRDGVDQLTKEEKDFISRGVNYEYDIYRRVVRNGVLYGTIQGRPFGKFADYCQVDVFDLPRL